MAIPALPVSLACDKAKMVAWRHHLHAHPETAFQEVDTAKMVADLLRDFGLEVHTGLARTGVVGVLRNGEGPMVGLRADMDALPIQEQNSFAHKSRHDGRMHACGHDGHTTMLLGAACHLAQKKDFQGTIVFIFQPAEENEGGGKLMVDEGLFTQFPVQAVFGMHNWPGLPAGSFGIRTGAIMAAYDLFEITLRGGGVHAAMPHQGPDTILAAAQLTTLLQAIPARMISPLSPVVLSVTQIHGGDTWNVIPDEVVLRGSARHLDTTTQDRLEAAMRNCVNSVGQAFGIETHTDYQRRYPATVNTPPETIIATKAAQAVAGQENVQEDVDPSMAAEDFGYMLEHRPGAYIWIGNAGPKTTQGLHHSRYDFNDDILDLGAAYWVQLAQRFLAEQR